MAAISRRIALATTAALAGASLMVVALPARAVGLDYIEVTSTCTLAKAINIANLNLLARATVDCPGIADGTTTIRITSNSGTATNPLTGAESPGVQLDRTTVAAGDMALGGTATILPTILGDVTIEGDPTGTPPANGYSIYVNAAYSTMVGLPDAGHRIFAVYGALGGSLTLRNLNVGGGVAVPATGVGSGYGGAIYAQGALTLDHVTLIGNHVGGGAQSRWCDPDCEQYGEDPPAGSPGVGGAVYATGTLVVRSSVFESNTATGGSGTNGGAALGGAIGLGPAATASISDSVFTTNIARGGSGAAGANGGDGADGHDGGNGNCIGADVTTYSTGAVNDGEFNTLILGGVADPSSYATGGNGEGGRGGGNGGNGGNGGDAVGVISGGASVGIDHSAFLDNDAIAGAAGVEGLGGLGGDGGDGGNGVVCGHSRSASTVIDADETGIGNGGNGGDGGDNGASGSPGARGTAVQTVRSATVTLVDVTSVGGSSRVSDDTYGPQGRAAWEAKRAQLLDRGASGARAGVGGKAVAYSGGHDGLSGTAGSREAPATLINRERAAGLGLVSVIDATTSTTTSARISFSTFADVAPRVPDPGTPDALGNAGLRGNQSTPLVFTTAHGQIKGSLLWNPTLGGAGCVNLASAGWNVFGTGCHGEAGTDIDRSRDRITATRPVLDDSIGAGVQIRPPHSGGAAYRMPVLPLSTGSAAHDIALTTVAGGLQCRILGDASGYLSDDARHSTRPGGSGTSCDSGAYEDDGSDPYVMLTGDYRAYTGTPGQMTAVVARNPGQGTSLRLRVEGTDDVVFPAGFVTTANNDDTDVSEAVIPLGTSVDYPFAPTLTIDPTHGGVANITATIEGATGGTTTATNWMTLVNDGQVRVSADAPQQWNACQGYLPITYTASSVGHSPAPASTVRVFPNAVYPDNGNGLTTPPGEASSPVVNVAYASGTATVAVSAFDDSVIWSIPALAAGASVTLKLYVYVGRIVNSTDGYPVGATLNVGSSVVYQSGSTNTPLQPVSPIQGMVRVLSDIATLGGTLAGAEAEPSVEPVLKAGQSGTLYGTLDPGACAAPTDKHDWGYVHVTVKDHTSGAVLASYDTQNLKVDDNTDPVLDGNPWFPIPVTAPAGPGTYTLDFVYNSTPTDAVTTDSVVLQMPYQVDPVRGYVEGDTEAPESTTSRTFKAKLDRALTADVHLHWQVVSGTAQVGADLPAQSGDVTIPAGATEAPIALTVTNDATPEQDEYFVVQLSVPADAPLPQGAELTSAVSLAYIDDDDGVVATTLTPSPPATITAGDPVTPSVTLTAGGGALAATAVTLQQSADGTTGWTDVASYQTTLPGLATSAALTPATTTYYRWVYAGSAQFGASISAVTTVTVLSAPQPPDPPTGLHATGGDRQVNLSWTAPAAGADPVTDYLIEYATDGHTWIPFAHPASAATTATVTGLTNGTEYTFRVSAINGVGPGAASATATATPSGAAPAGTPTLTSSATDLSPGQTVTLTATGYQPGETLEFVLHSDPIGLGTAVADSAGTASWTGTVPEGIDAGRHQLVATGRSSALVATLDVTVRAATTDPGTGTGSTGGLAGTGVNAGGLSGLAGLLLCIGLALAHLGRRRRATA